MLLTIILIAIFSGIAIIVPSWPIIYNAERTGKKKITVGGYFLIAAVIALIALPAFLYNQQKTDEKEKDKQTKIDQDKRDNIQQRNYDSSLSVMQAKADRNNYKTDSIISENLGKYGYKFDSARNQLVNVINSNKVKAVDDPVLQIPTLAEHKGIEITRQANDSLYYEISLASEDAGSTGFKIKYSFLAEDFQNKLIYMGNYSPLNYNDVLSKSLMAITHHDITHVSRIKIIYVWAKGTYKNTDKTKTFEINQVVFLNLIDKKMATESGTEYDRIVAEVLKHENK